MSINGVWQIKDLVVSYCKHGGSSKGVRTLLESKPYKEYKSSFPSSVSENLRNGKHPHLIGTYAHGGKKMFCVKNMEPAEILKHMERLKNSQGLKARTWVERKRIVTKKPSIQGQWTPWVKLDNVTKLEVTE